MPRLTSQGSSRLITDPKTMRTARLVARKRRIRRIKNQVVIGFRIKKWKTAPYPSLTLSGPFSDICRTGCTCPYSSAIHSATFALLPDHQKMNPNHLDFEQPIDELEAKIRELRNVGSKADMNLEEEIARLEQKCHERTRTIFSELSDWQISQLARHPDRPYTLDYLPIVIDRFQE